MKKEERLIFVVEAPKECTTEQQLISSKQKKEAGKLKGLLKFSLFFFFKDLNVRHWNDPKKNK